MKAREIMTASPVFCSAETPVTEVARLMCSNDCGAIPVVDQAGMPLGVVTDRDIVCRIVAQNKNALDSTARDCMSEEPVTVKPETGVEECCDILERRQIRRLLVVDEAGRCCGIIAQADIARHAPAGQTAEVVREVSRA